MSKFIKHLTYTSIVASTLIINATNATILYDKDGVSFDVFGKVVAGYFNDALYQDISGENSNLDNGTIYPFARIGIAMRSPVVHGLDGIAMAEWETTKANGRDGGFDNTRYMFAGIDAYQYGTLIFGRGDNAFYTVAGATDIFNIIEGHASDYFMFGDQRNSMIMYSLRALDWDLKLSYEFPHHDLGNTPLQAKRGMAASVSSKFGENITVAYGIDYYKFDYNYKRAEGEAFFASMLAFDKDISFNEALSRTSKYHISTKKEYGAAISYGINGQDLYASLVVSATAYDYLAHHIYSLDSVVSYSFTNGVTLSAGYGTKLYKDEPIISELSLGAAYKFNKSFKVFAEAQIDLNGKADQFYNKEFCKSFNLNENKFALGAEFSF